MARFAQDQDFDASEGLLTAAEVAALYRVDMKTIHRQRKAGRMPHLRIPGGGFRYSRKWHREDLEGDRG